MSPTRPPDHEPALDDDWLDARVLLERQTAVLELIAGAAPLREVLTEIISSLEQLMEGAKCSALLLDREHGTLHHGAAPNLPEDYVAAIDGMSIGDGAGSCGTAAAIDAEVVVTDVGTDPRWVHFRAAAEAAGLRSCWSTPIEGRDGLPVGTFAVYHAHPHCPTRRDERLVERFTHLASVAIDHAGLLGDLVESEERFRRSFDSNSLGMAILRPDRAIARSNKALTALAGRSELGGTSFTELVTPAGSTLEAWLDELNDGDESPTTFEGTLHRNGRSDVEVEVTVSLLHDRSAVATQYIVNVLDLSERRAAERDRRARLKAETARQTAEELSHAKSELLAAVGHEARTPIQAIVGFAELLGTIDLDEARRREALDHIGGAARHVMDLLTDVLDLSRLEANALPLVLEPVRLLDVVAEVFGLLSSKAEQRRVSLSHDLTDDVAHADRRRLRQVLLNLVDNAIRHGRTGGRVQIRSRPTTGDRYLALTVDDDGPGIPGELRSRLFTPFSRADSAAGASSTSGPGDRLHDESIGLGLGLAHGLMSAMGGSLSVGSSSSTGTSMLVRVTRFRPTIPTP